jgi:hypothetical protein
MKNFKTLSLFNSLAKNVVSAKICIGVIITAISLMAAGCASIVDGGARLIAVDSTPQGATLTVVKKGDASGNIVYKGATPATIALSPRAGYFRGQAYVLKLELAGYNSAEVEINPSLSGWYFGNIIFGGLIGMIAVDPATGAMWNLSPKNIQQTLSPTQASLIKSNEGFVVVLVSSLTEEEKANMVRIL